MNLATMIQLATMNMVINHAGPGSQNQVAQLDQAISTIQNAPSTFESSIDPRYQKYLDVNHGLQFKPRESQRISMGFRQVSYQLRTKVLRWLTMKGFKQTLTQNTPLDVVSDDTVEEWFSELRQYPPTESVSTKEGSPGSVMLDMHPSLHLMLVLSLHYSFNPTKFHSSISTTETEDLNTSITIPFSKTKFLKILETFHLPAAYLQSLFTGTARTLRYARDDVAERQGLFVSPLGVAISNEYRICLSVSFPILPLKIGY